MHTHCSNWSPLSFSLGSSPLDPLTKGTSDRTLQMKWWSLHLTWPVYQYSSHNGFLPKMLSFEFRAAAHTCSLPYLPSCSVVVSFAYCSSSPWRPNIGVPHDSVQESLFQFCLKSLSWESHLHDFEKDLNASDSYISGSSLDPFPELKTPISYYLLSISVCMSNRHLRLPMSNTALLVFPWNQPARFLISLNSILLVDQVKNLGLSLVPFLFHTPCLSLR